MDYTDAAQDFYEEGLTLREEAQLDAIAEAKSLKSEIGADDLAFELADCAEDIVSAIQHFDAGLIRIADLGLVLLNLRDAMCHRRAKVHGAPFGDEAIGMAMRGEAV